jgi:alanine dehydrogenase
MSIAITLFTKQQLLPQEEKLEVSRKKAIFIGIPKETCYQERRICLTQMPLTLSFNGHRDRIRAGKVQVILTKNIVMPEVTKDTVQVFVL